MRLARSNTCKFALLLLRVFTEEALGNNKLQDGISQEFQPFVMSQFPVLVFVEIGTVSKGFG